ncbi:MAG: cytochrome c3 family protein [Minicystis sp.]
MTAREPARRGTAPGGGQRRRWIIALAALLLAALAVAGFRADSYARHDPRLCAGACHAPKDGAPGWHTTGHQDVPCQSCHATSAGTSYELLWKKVTSAKHLPRHGKPSVAACTSCHDKDPVGWRQIEATEGHRAHRGVKDLDCLSCHAENAHQQGRPTADTCTKCHAPAQLHKVTTGAESCTSCHAFAVPARRADEPRSTACGGCHADKGTLAATATKVVDESTVHGNLDCKLCHSPHDKKPAAPNGQPMCARCHRIELPKNAGVDHAGHKDCQGCHQPHAPRKHALDSCVKCHETRVKGLAQVVPALPFATRRTVSALRHESCASCHTPHTFRAEPNGCVTCHQDQATSIKTKSPAAHDACANCHDVHGPPPTAMVCLKCHGATKQSHLATAPGRHQDCTSCHAPHAATKSAARESCAGCHTAPHAEVGHDGPRAHQEKSCFTCHKPHDDPRPAADVCARCHADKSKLVAAAEPVKHRACASCHTPHKFAIADKTAACGKCHERQVTVAASWPATSAHAGACQSCHQPHDVKSRKACSDCHAKETSSALGGKHRCAQCHAPHQETPGPGPAWWSKCASCHATQATGARTRGPTHAACQNCHKPHRFDVPSCASCHADVPQKGLHVVKGHVAKCNACHETHAKSEPGRAECLSCHTNKRQHEPEASKCQACHPFR